MEITIPVESLPKEKLFLSKSLGKLSDPQTGETYEVTTNLLGTVWLLRMPDGVTLKVTVEDVSNALIQLWKGRVQ